MSALESSAKRPTLAGKSPFTVKVYIVFLAMNLAKVGEPNRKILDVLLRKEDAERLVGQTPGAYWERHVASKSG